MNRLIAVDVLEEAGFEVLDFGRADEAIGFAEDRGGDVAAVFTDINVPGDRDGIELAQYFAKRWPSALVLVTSGRFGAARPAELPPDALYMSKPWRGKDVIQALRPALPVH